MIGTSKAWFCGNDGSVYELTGQGGSWFPSYGKNFTYTGEYVIVPEGDSGDWKVKFLTSGTFTATDALLIDVFAVGGGGGGGASYPSSSNVGKQGGSTTGFNITANGGYGVTDNTGEIAGNGGSGGGGCSNPTTTNTGGSDGSDGKGSGAGKGQGTTTREFGETSGELYAGGGGGGTTNSALMNSTGGSGGGGHGGYGSGSTSNYPGKNGTANTGGGGGGWAYSSEVSCGGGGGYTTTQKSVYLEKDREYEIIIGDGGAGMINGANPSLHYGGTGGSGILIIRNHRE